MKIEIEKHTPFDGEYFLISIDNVLFAKTYTEKDAQLILDMLKAREVNDDFK